MRGQGYENVIQIKWTKKFVNDTDKIIFFRYSLDYEDELDEENINNWRSLKKEEKRNLNQNSIMSLLLLFISYNLTTLDYLINAHCAFTYFHEKSCPVRPFSIVVSSTITALCVYLFFKKIPCPVRLFHTVRLFDSPEYLPTYLYQLVIII